MARWTPPVPGRFGAVPTEYGLLFSCTLCGRHVAVSRDNALAAWGVQGRVAETLARLRCRYCRRRGVLKVELAPLKARLGTRPPLEKLLAQIRALKPGGTVK